MANIFQIKGTGNKIGKLVDKIRETIEGSVFQDNVYIVGGVIRDFLIYGEEYLNKCHDVDIVVTAPNGGQTFALWFTHYTKCHVVDKNPVLFPTYGTSKFQILSDPELRDIEIECVQTRKEKYNKESRNPVTAYGTINEDAMRRDLTINALYYNISKDEILDITGKGFDDIDRCILRTTGEPDAVFDDDPLRILRVVRFASRLGWGIESKTWLGMITNAKRIKILSQERVTDELNKMLLCDKPSDAMRRLDRCNALGIVIPSLEMSKHVYQDVSPLRTLYEHVLDTMDKTPKVLETRLAALFHDIGKLRTYDKGFMFHSKIGADMAEEVLRAMKYPNATISTVKKAIEYHEDFSQYWGNSIPRASVIRKFVSKFDGNDKDLDVALDLIHANNITQMYGKKVKFVEGVRRKIAELDKTNESGKKIILPVNGNELMKALGLRPGPTLGFLINHIKRKVIEDPTLTKEGAIECAKKYLEAVV